AAVRAGGLPDHWLREGVDQRPARAGAALPLGVRCRDDERGPPDARRQAHGVGHGPRLSSAAGARPHSRRRRHGACRARARRPPGVVWRTHLRPRRHHRPGHRTRAGGRRHRACDDGHRGPPARPRAGGVPPALWRAADAGTHRLHARDGQDAEELMVVLGRGQPLLVIPGLQGRWQWMLPGIRALAAHRRVITYSLAGDGEDLLPLVATRFDDLVRQARNALARAGVSRATVCGVSYGALIATRLAARHPELVSSLVLASPLPPDFVPDARVRRLIRHPRLLAPGFLAAAPARTLPEIRCARPDDWPACAATMLALVARWPQSPVRMAERIRWLADESLVGDARQVR